MKKLKVIILFIVIILLGVGGYLLYSSNYKDSNNLSTQKEDIKLSNSRYAIYIENEEGNYELSGSNAFPTEGYVFNKEESYCKNGTYLEWDEINNSLLLNTSTKDKCFIYFSIVVEQTFADYIIELAATNSHIYYHNGTITSTSVDIDNNNTILDAEDLSYRYSGSAEEVTDNYVCFGYDIDNYNNECTAINFATSNYSYKIIGAIPVLTFNETKNAYEEQYLVKIIKYGVYEYSKWVPNSGDTFNWNNTSLNYEVLNSKSKSTSENLESGFLYEVRENGWDNYIAIPTWYVGNYSWENVGNTSPKNAYNEEIKSSNALLTISHNKIGLIYDHDYGFAASPRNWQTKLVDYNTVIENNWLFSYATSVGYDRWIITGSANVIEKNNGRINGYGDRYYGYSQPTFYLSSNVLIDTDNMSDTTYGTTSNPYRLKLD